MFIEPYGLIPNRDEAIHLLDAGVIYLIYLIYRQIFQVVLE